MNDKEFLNWVADRLVNVYKESENVDFVIKLRKIAEALRPAPHAQASEGARVQMNFSEVAANILAIFPKATKNQKAAVFDAFLEKFKKESPLQLEKGGV